MEAAGPGVQESLRCVPGGHPQSVLAAQQGVGDPRALGRNLPDGLSPDLSHDGALTPQVLETEAQKAVNDKGCRAGVGSEPGPPARPSGHAELWAPPARETQTHSSWGSQPSPGTFPWAGGGATAVPAALTPPHLARGLSQAPAGPAAAPPTLGARESPWHP